MFSKRFAPIAFFIVCTALTGAAGQEVSHDPPAIYREKLAALLTPLDAVLHSEPADAESEDGVVLLDEDIHYLDDQGRRYIVLHHVSKALNDSGAKENADDTWSYRKANQKIHLVLARTILPDGKEMPVQPGAVLLQTPQRQADYSLYNDEGELRVIFPSVKPGSVTESIVVIEESKFRIPGEFTMSFSMAFGWPVQKIRYVVEAPSTLAARLKASTVGEGVPEPKKEEPSKDRVRLTWGRENVGHLPRDQNRPPTQQIGPALWLTTLPDWNAFVRWYAPLVAEHATLKPQLAAKVDEWTKDAHSPKEILDVLTGKASTDVRYVGLEFGTADLQPHDCNAVWENQYGDCKDKANLLCAMLKYKGIKACIVLLNTSNTGRIQRQSPDYRQFSHAIVAAELEQGAYTFCDATITYAKPGCISPDDADRDVLLVKGDVAEWAHTPRQDAGTVTYDLDLKLGTDGELSGWMTQESTGYYGVWYADDYQRMDKDRLRQTAHDIVQGFFKGAEIVDVTRTPLDKWDGIYRLKMYFIVHAANRDDAARKNLSFPQSGALFVDLGPDKKRATPYYLWADTTRVNAKIKLPDGFDASGLPQPYKLQSPPLDINARWDVKDRTCIASLELHTKQNLVMPDHFAVMFNALLSVHAWLDNPVALSIAASGTEQPAAKEVTLEDFPMMLTGDGQLELVDQRYPDSGDTKLRREALEKVKQYFPSDKSTLFNAGVRLATLDWQDNKIAEAADQIRNLLQAYRGNINNEDRAWGEYMLARVNRDTEHTDEARKLFAKIAGDKAVSPYRRAWSDFQIGFMIQKKSPDEAIKALREGLAFDVDAKPEIFALLAKLLILEGHIDDLKKEIAQMIESKPPQFAAMLTRLAETAGTMLPDEKAKQRAALIDMLDNAGANADLGKAFYDAVRTSRDNIRSIAAASGIRDSLRKYFLKHPPEKLDEKGAHFKTRTEFSRAVEAGENERNPDLCLRYDIELLMKFEPDADFPFYLWKAASNAEWKERFHEKPEPLLPVLLDLCDELPSGSDAYLDGKFLRAKVCARRGDLEGAGKIYEELMRFPKIPRGYLSTAHKRYGENLQARHEYQKALEVFRMAEAETEYSNAKDCLLEATLLNLELGKNDEALRVLDILRGCDSDGIKQAVFGVQINQMLAFTSDRKKAVAFWESTAKWRPAWLELEKELGMKTQGDAVVVAAISDLSDLEKEMDGALNAKDRTTYFDDMRKLAHGAYWQPGLVCELASELTWDTAGFIPDYADEMRRFVILLNDNFASDDPALVRRMQYYAAVNYINTYDYPKAVKMIRAFEAVPQPDDGFTQGMARLWGMAAKQEKAETAPAMAALEKSLASSNFHEQRVRSVTILADLYRIAGRGKDEENLLKTEMENPRVKSSEADLQTITTRYEELAKTGTESTQMLHAAEGWIRKHKPAWYDFAEPMSLADKRLHDLDTVLENPDAIFNAPEAVKLEFLVALSPAQSYDVRGHAFLHAIERLCYLALTRDEAAKTLDELIGNADFPEWIRVEFLWTAMGNARAEGRTADFEKLRANPLAAKFNQRTKATCDTFHTALAVDQSSVDSISGFCDKLLQREVDGTGLDELRQGYDRLLALGAIDAANGVYGRLAEINFESSLKINRPALQLEFLRKLEKTKKWQPLASAMRNLVLGQYPADTIKQPAAQATLKYPNRYYFLEEEVQQQIRLFQVKTQRCDPEDFVFWKYFIRNLSANDAGRKLGNDLMETAIRMAPDDLARSNAILTLGEAIDVDDVAQYSRFMALVQPYNNVGKYPQSYGGIRLMQIHHAFRTGQPFSVETDFQDLQHPDTAANAQRTKLRYYLQTQNLALLGSAVDSIPADELLSDRLLEYALKAFELLGRKDELALARDAAKKSIYRNVLFAWCGRDAYDLCRAYDFANGIHDVSGIPPTCIDDVCAVVLQHHDKAWARVDDAYVRGDWARTLSCANEAIALFPTYYHLYWLKGAALYHLGRKPEAVEPLQIFTRYSKDELEYQQASDWLKEIQLAKKD